MTDTGAAPLRPALFQTRIRQWYLRNGRRLPWRGIRDPYRIVVSEIMLQQTQVSRVLEKYPVFLRRFPTFTALAKAPQADVVRAWQGLGYNNRAVRLHRLARTVREMPGRRLPESMEELIRLPGIGKYTAHAILCSAFNHRVPVVDVNVQRFFSRLFWRMPATDHMRAEREIWKTAWHMLPDWGVYAWSQALMDLGATVCTSRAPRCNSCPVAGSCRSRPVMQRGTHGAPHREPSWQGIPDRIHRGKIVELLRVGNGGATIGTIRKTLALDGELPPKRWLESLLVALERDGVIRRVSGGRRVSLA